MGMKDRILAAGLTVAEVARKAGTPTAHLYNILCGVRRPRPELAKRIEAATGGLIRATELLGLDHGSTTAEPAA